MLAGIVAMQVEVLKLGASMGRAIEQTTALQSRNELLRASVASLADDQRIERLAGQMGMVMPAPTAIDFLSARRVNLRRAAADIHQPDAADVPLRLQSEAAASSNQSLTTTSTPGATTTASGSPDHDIHQEPPGPCRLLRRP